MKIYKLKKNTIFSLIALLLCCLLIYSTNSLLNVTDFINTKIETIKEKEMKYVFGERNTLGDNYPSGLVEYDLSNVSYHDIISKPTENTIVPYIYDKQQAYMLFQNTNNVNTPNYLTLAQTTTIELEKQIGKDSYRNRKFGLYYVFNYDYTIDALKELDIDIEKISKAQKTPKALVQAVIFREMMFLGQEDLLDGIPFIGGKSMGICQIGIENARYNDQIVHGKDSVIVKKTDDEIKTMLQNPKQAVYFCTVQLRARAIKLSGDKNVDLNHLTKEQLHKILEEYNQSKITVNLGPVMTKAKYAEETYKYYELFSKF